MVGNGSPKDKREAPMAEPSTEYSPPRIEAPYATYSPLQLQSLGENGQNTSPYFLANTYNSPTPTPSNLGSDLSGYDVQTLQKLEQCGNEIGSDLSQSVSGDNGAYKFGNQHNAANIYGIPAPKLSAFNRLTSGSESFEFLEPQQRDPYYGNAASASPNRFFEYLNGRKLPTLGSNIPANYATGAKDLGQHTQPFYDIKDAPAASLRNSKPVASTSENLLGKPASYIGEQYSHSSFRPSYFLGSSFVSSKSDYQPTATSVGTGNQHLTSSSQYSPLQTRLYRPPVTAKLTPNLQLPNHAMKPIITQYGVPYNIFYAQNEPRAKAFKLPFSNS